jgi:ubiquinone/menaquinone biosynthesis C-methylase UbiE
MSSASTLRRLMVRNYYAMLKVLCPGLRNSHFTYRDMLNTLVLPETTWLDLGCGHQFFPDWMTDIGQAQAALVGRCASVIGVDPYDLRPHTAGITKIAADAERLPFEDSSFSLVTANMVVEHVEDPERLLREVHRVLKPGGVFLFHTPNARYFEVAIARHIPASVMKAIASVLDGRAQEDIFETHYRLNTAGDIRTVATGCGLQAQQIRHVECTAQGVMLGPLVAIELLIIRMLRMKRFENYRSDLVVVLEKAAVAEPAPRQLTLKPAAFSLQNI